MREIIERNHTVFREYTSCHTVSDLLIFSHPYFHGVKLKHELFQVHSNSPRCLMNDFKSFHELFYERSIKFPRVGGHDFL